MQALKKRIEHFLDNVLYSDSTNGKKYDDYQQILSESRNLVCTDNEKEYILSQLTDVVDVSMYNIPLLARICQRFLENYNTYYGIHDIHSTINDFNDLNHAILGEITPSLFGQIYHGDVGTGCQQSTTNNLVVTGVRWGINNRLLICLPISRRNTTDSNSIWCTFIINTCSSYNYISNETQKKLDIDTIASSTNICISGITTRVYPSQFDSRLKGINILGNDFFDSCNCSLCMEYSNGDCNITLSFKEEV